MLRKVPGGFDPKNLTFNSRSQKKLEKQKETTGTKKTGETRDAAAISPAAKSEGISRQEALTALGKISQNAFNVKNNQKIFLPFVSKKSRLGKHGTKGVSVKAVPVKNFKDIKEMYRMFTMDFEIVQKPENPKKYHPHLSI